MGTRGIMGFTSGDQLVITYNHYDSYPESLGKTIFEWAKQANLEEARGKLARIKLVDESDHPTKEQEEDLRATGFTPQNVGLSQDFYAWLRDAQGNPELALMRSEYMTDGSAFAYDSGYIEWGYIVDFDKRTVEVYKGDNSRPKAGRFDDPDKNGLPLILTVQLEDTVITTGDEFVRAVYAA